jgi:hypothetical protein
LALQLCLLAFCLPALAQRKTQVAPQVYFRQDWCPEPPELEDLARFASVDMNGCCVRRLLPSDNMGMPAGSLTAYKSRVIDTMDDAECSGSNTATRAAAELAEQAARAEAEEIRRQLPKELRAAGASTICALAGKAIRGELPVPGLVMTELRRRKLTVDQKRAQSQTMRIGDSECQLFASYGLPSNSSRTVTRRGTWVRHDYEAMTVRTVNGIVETWQD